MSEPSLERALELLREHTPNDGEQTRARLAHSIHARARLGRAKLALSLAATLAGTIAFALYQRPVAREVPVPAQLTPGRALPPQPTAEPARLPAADDQPRQLETRQVEARKRRRPAPVVPRTDPERAVAPVAERDQSYLSAHRLQFRGAPGEALAAWDRFLAIEPAGSRAAEARYNRGVALMRLGRNTDARAALAPFARGDYGAFRRAEAQRLIEELASRR
jgi:hypothetical protein